MQIFAVIGVLFACCAAHAAFAADGTAVGVDPNATATLENVGRTLEVGADVSVGELVTTGPGGQVQMVFSDNTRLVVGANSSLLIETYLLTGEDTAQSFAINALSGTFRFVTGDSPKGAYSIRTPTAAIAVRGTQFDLVVEERATYVLLYDGALEICSGSNLCVALDERCEIGAASHRQAKLFAAGSVDRLQQSYGFHYARFQDRLLPGFRVRGASLCAEPDSASNLVGGGNTNSTSEVLPPFSPTLPPTTGPDTPLPPPSPPEPEPTAEPLPLPEPDPVPIPEPDREPRPAPGPAPRPIPQ